MFFIAGVSSKIKPVGVSLGCHCPACGQTADLHIIHKYLTPHLFFIPTFRFRSSYVATCSRCASIMALDPAKGAAFRRDPSQPIAPGDLQVVQNNRSIPCAHCGSRSRPGENFCAHCGHPLGENP